MEIIFYSTHCPRCRVLQQKLDQKGLKYIENNNVDEMLAQDFTSAPALKVDEEKMDFSRAIEWVNQYEGLKSEY